MGIYRMRTEFGKHLKVGLAVVAFIFIVGAVWQFGAAPPGSRQRGDQKVPIAVVNGIPISRGEFDAVWSRRADLAKTQGVKSTLQLARFRASVFQELVDSRLSLTAAKEMGIDVSQGAVDERREELITEYLKQGRRSALGKVSKEEEEIDPRDDRRYKDTLAQAGRSVLEMEERARMEIPEAQVRVEVAQQGVRDAIKKRIGKITDKDIDASYGVYKVRQIVLEPGKMPEEQLKSRAQKIVKQARDGADFAKLAEEYSQGPFKNMGGQTEYSLDRYAQSVQMAMQGFVMTPLEIWPAVKKLKVGGVSNVITTDMGLYIVKLEGITSAKPDKLDKKAKAERRKQIQQVGELQGLLDFDKLMRRKSDVKVDDPEMAGYWYLSQARKLRGERNEKGYEKQIALAAAQFRRALKVQTNNPYAAVTYAQVLEEQGKVKDAVKVLYPMLEGGSVPVQGADVRMWLGDMFVKLGGEEDKERAITQYEKASGAAVIDRGIHQQLVTKFKDLGREDLAAAEEEWITKFDERAKIRQEREAAEKNKKSPKSGG